MNPVARVFDPQSIQGAVIYALLLFGLAALGARIVHALTLRVSAQRAHYVTDLTPVYFFSQLLQVGLFLIAGILYAHLIPELRSLGTALLTGVSVVSVIVGLAAQNTLGNLIAGFSLVLYHPFRIGDQIQLSTPKGIETARIESLTLGYTILTTDDKRHIVVPNSVIASAIIINLTGSDAEVHSKRNVATPPPAPSS